MQNKGLLRRWANALINLHREYIMPFKYHYGAIGDDSYIRTPAIIDGASNIFLGDHVHIKGNCCILTVGDGKFIVKGYLDTGIGLTVIASNHGNNVGRIGHTNEDNYYRDVVIEEDVWIGAHVTLCAGAHVGRGCIIGANAVIRGIDIPPYAIVIGNPAKIVGFRFTPEQCVEHERIVYSEQERIPLEIFSRNYQDYFASKRDQIKHFKSISL